MKLARSIIKSITVCFFVLFTIIFASLIYVECNVSDYYSINSGNELDLDSPFPIRTSICSSEDSLVNYGMNAGDTFKMDVKVLGIIPAKQISVRVVDKTYVAVMGTPFGIKIYIDGVLVSGFSGVETENGTENPAKDAGLGVGDFIISLNDVKVYTNEDVANIIKKSEGGLIVAKIKQKNKKVANISADDSINQLYFLVSSHK